MKLTLLSTLAISCSLTACGGSQPADTSGAETVAPPAADSADAEEAAEGCVIPEGLTPIAPVISMPQVSAPDSVKFELETAMLELGPDGAVDVGFEFDARNKGDAPAELVVGFAWRIQQTGPGAAIEFSKVLLQVPEATPESCAIDGPAEMQQRFRDVVVYSRATLGPGQSITVKGSYLTAVRAGDVPNRLFGYPDHFGDNWKNYDWPFTKAKAYEEIAGDLTPFFGRFVPGKANRSQITLRSKSGESWIRTMSHQQNVERLRMRGAYRWEFYGDQKPSQVYFEYLPGVELEQEIGVFRAIVRERRDDLRARIRLADLASRAGDAEAEAEILDALLSRWKKKRAEEQQLVGRNDVRGPAYVALVRALAASERAGEAKQRAAEGYELLDGFEAKVKEIEMNRLILDWLDLER
jgi:hypothetical protein